MEFKLSGAPYLPAPRTVGQIMREVLLALVPGIIAHAWFFGPGVLVQILIAASAALSFEYAMLRLRGRPVRLFLTDGSVLVTAVLFSLCIPPLTPWWAAVIGMFFAVVVAKHLYGGLGYNMFNPAMVGFVVLLIAFPTQMTLWVPPAPVADYTLGLAGTLQAIFTGTLPGGLTWDAITQATPLDTIKTETGLNRTLPEIRQHPIFGKYGGRGWEWIANFYLLGGIWLLWRRIITWHIPVALIGMVMLLSLPLHVTSPDTQPFPLQHIYSGGLVLGAFFVATDPVSSATTPRGRLIFAAGIGALVVTIRTWGGYPDAVAFSVLLMNLAVPLIDTYTAPRIFGHPK